MTQDPLVLLLVVLYGIFVSFVEERFGKFQDFPPQTKQLVNALAGFVAPLMLSGVAALLGAWPSEIGTPEALTMAILVLVVPVVSWLVTQVAHAVDRWLAKIGRG